MDGLTLIAVIAHVGIVVFFLVIAGIIISVVERKNKV